MPKRKVEAGQSCLVDRRDIGRHCQPGLGVRS
jgi:hypothetical protein